MVWSSYDNVFELKLMKKSVRVLIVLVILINHSAGYCQPGFIKGKVTQPNSSTPVSFADIFSASKTLFTRSNSKGEFILYPGGFPVKLTIRKFGFKDETIILNNPDDQLLISLTPLEVHKSYSGALKVLDYDLIFKKALEKLKSDNSAGLHHNSKPDLVYCNISSSVDSTLNSFFESYALMNVSGNTIRDYQPRISRYVSAEQNIPGVTQQSLEFNLDSYINLPIMSERLITHKDYLMQDNAQIAAVKIGLDKTITTYFINVADTSILFISSIYSPGKKQEIPGLAGIWQRDRVKTAEISFSRTSGSATDYIIDWAVINDKFSLVENSMPPKDVSTSTFFALVPDSSINCAEVRDEVANEASIAVRKQVNFRGRLAHSNYSTEFNSEMEKLLMKPYKPGFWSHSSLLLPDINQQKQIEKWEISNRFYSQDQQLKANEKISKDSLVILMNNSLVAVENVYIETDRSSYLAGDTIWFSAFILNNKKMDSTSLSRILYVDLINIDNIPEKHLKLIIKNGRSHGDFVIDKKSRNGIYHLRAYTQYMRNYQREYLFEKELTVHNSDFSDLISLNPVIRRNIEGDSVELNIKAFLPDDYQVQDKKLEIIAKINDTLSVRKIFNVKKIINEFLGFFVPSRLSCRFIDVRIILSGTEVICERRQSVPLKSGINLQFFPESGKMVADLKTVIACKAIDDRGYPAGYEADIVDESGKKINHISGSDSGVSSFAFTPHCHHSYQAFLNYQGNKYAFNLPEVEPTGYVMNYSVDSTDMIIKNNTKTIENKYYILFSVRGVIYDAIETKLGISPLKIHLPLDLYPKGIIQVTLYDNLFRPLAERLVFNNQPDEKMSIRVTSDKNIYKNRDSVTLTLNVTDVNGRPVASSLSLSVVDASKIDSTASFPDIESYLYLTSELKGRIDYKLLNLSDTTFNGAVKRDLVMMTQGWRNYLWNSIRFTDSYSTKYPVEKGFSIDGSVYTTNNGEVPAGYQINYLDFKSTINGVAKVDSDNKFRIDLPFFHNSHVFFIQNKNLRYKTGNLGFVIDTFPLPEVTYRKNQLPFSSFRAAALKDVNDKINKIDSSDIQFRKYIKIPEVVITAKSDHTGYSSPDKIIDLVKKDPTGNKYQGIFQMIYEEFGDKAFTATGYGTTKEVSYPILVVDGAPLTSSRCPPCYDFDAYGWATKIPVREISEVKFYAAQSQYSQWLSPPPADRSLKHDVTGTLELYWIVYPKLYLPVISIKTSSKYRGNPRGAVVLPFQGIYQAREFYKPDIENNQIDAHDHRTTIFWDPEVQTDSSGTAKVTFSNSGIKGKVIIRISGVSFSLNDASSTSGYYLSQ